MQNIESGLVAANDNDEFRFYVYAWQYPDGRTFYVGKGSGRRDKEEVTGRNKIFKRIVAKIRREGGEPLVARWQSGLREIDAHRLEMAYIKVFGRRSLGTGTLCNLTDGGEGSSGYVHHEDALTKMRGRKRSDEHIVNLLESLRVSMSSQDVRMKLSKATTAAWNDEESRSKMVSAMRGRKISENHKGRIAESLRARGPRGGLSFKGIVKNSSGWSARLWDNGRDKYLGTFPTPEEAARAYDKAAFATWGGDCYLNFPEEHTL